MTQCQPESGEGGRENQHFSMTQKSEETGSGPGVGSGARPQVTPASQPTCLRSRMLAAGASGPVPMIPAPPPHGHGGGAQDYLRTPIWDGVHKQGLHPHEPRAEQSQCRLIKGLGCMPERWDGRGQALLVGAINQRLSQVVSPPTPPQERVHGGGEVFAPAPGAKQAN